MQIISLLKKEYIINALEATTKKDVIAEIAEALAGRTGISPARVSEILEEREKLGTTGIGDGVAIPHGKLEDIKDTVIFFGRSEAGIPFNSMDGRPVHLFFILIAPENTNGKHLKILARISRMLKDEKFRSDLLQAGTVDSLYKIIESKDKEEI
jgi:PTS system nitrogen regulatory IIA component